MRYNFTRGSTCTRCGGHQFRIYCVKCDPNYPEEIASLKAERDEYRAALERVASIEDEPNGGDWCEIDKAREIAKQALAGKE